MKTTIKNDGMDEVYEEWFICQMCNYGYILSDANYCPGCGAEITKDIIWKTNYSKRIA